MPLIHVTATYIIHVHMILRCREDPDSIYFFPCSPKCSKLCAKEPKFKTLKDLRPMTKTTAAWTNPEINITISSSSGHGRKSITWWSQSSNTLILSSEQTSTLFFNNIIYTTTLLTILFTLLTLLTILTWTTVLTLLTVHYLEYT